MRPPKLESTLGHKSNSTTALARAQRALADPREAKHLPRRLIEFACDDTRWATVVVRDLDMLPLDR